MRTKTDPRLKRALKAQGFRWYPSGLCWSLLDPREARASTRYLMNEETLRKLSALPLDDLPLLLSLKYGCDSGGVPNKMLATDYDTYLVPPYLRARLEAGI